MRDVDHQAEVLVERAPGRPVVRLAGHWTTPFLLEIEEQLERLAWPDESQVRLDASEIAQLDTGGAWALNELVSHLEADEKQVWLDGLSEEYEELLDLVRKRTEGVEREIPPTGLPFFERLGRMTWELIVEAMALIAFTGEAFVALIRSIRNPRRFRWRTLLQIIQTSGVNALFIVGLLSFLLGVVIAYQGGIQLRNYGANIFIVELVTVTFFRELGPLMAAIIVAGRTGSAFTAEIGTMRVTEEVDALTTIGIDPIDILVIPKMLGLMIALPLLTVFADAMGVLGGMVMAELTLDVEFESFFERLPEVIEMRTFAVGISKAPAFAAIIATVGCFQGFQVRGGAEAVGRHTTTSVVQAIFLVIVADALFSIVYSWMGI